MKQNGRSTHKKAVSFSDTRIDEFMHSDYIEHFLRERSQAPFMDSSALQIYRNFLLSPQGKRNHIFNDLSEGIQVFKCLRLVKHYLCMYLFLPGPSLLFRVWGKAPVSFRGTEELTLDLHCLEDLRKRLCYFYYPVCHIPYLSPLLSCFGFLDRLFTPNSLCTGSLERGTHLIVKLPFVSSDQW